MKRSAKIVKAYTVLRHKTANSIQQDMAILSAWAVPGAPSAQKMQEEIGHGRGTYVRAQPKTKRVKLTKKQWSEKKAVGAYVSAMLEEY